MKTHGIVSILLAAGFVGFCFWPIAATNLSIGKQTDAMIRAAENRPMTPRPNLNVFGMRYSAVKRLPGQLEEYLVDTFPYRLNMVDGFAFMQQGRVESLNGKGIFGLDGWMFMNDHSFPAGNTMDDFLGFNTLELRDFDAHFADLDRKRRLYEEQGIRFYLLIAPNKVTIYPEHLPEELRQAKGETIREQYMAFYRERIAREGIRDFIIDPTEALRTRAAAESVYFPLDTHWTWEGRIVAGRLLLDRIRRDFPELGDIPNLVMEAKPAWAGLANMLGVKIPPERQESSLFPKEAQWNSIDKHSEDASVITTGATLRHYYNRNNTVDIFFAGDSFMNDYQPLPEAFVFRNSYYVEIGYNSPGIMRKLFDKTLEIRPAIVVDEIVERNIMRYTMPAGL